MFNRARSIVGNAVVFNFNSILIVRIETENRNAAVRSAEPVGDAVSNFLTVGLRHDAHGCIVQFIAAVADDGGERCNLIGIHKHLADLALRLKMHCRSRRTAGCAGGS